MSFLSNNALVLYWGKAGDERLKRHCGRTDWVAESASVLTAGRGMGVESRQPDLCLQQWSQGLSTRSSFRSTLAARTFLVLRSGYGSILSIFLVPSDVHNGIPGREDPGHRTGNARVLSRL